MNQQSIYMVIDIDKCWGCKACQVACKQEHGIPEGSGNIDVIKIEQRDEQNNLYCDFIPVLCNQCDSPECMEVCPTEAIYRDDEGLVALNRDLCITCGACVEACSYGGVHITTINGEERVMKCDLCRERRSRNFLPSCEQHCMGKVFETCDKYRMEELTKGRYNYCVGRVVYVSSKLIELGQYWD